MNRVGWGLRPGRRPPAASVLVAQLQQTPRAPHEVLPGVSLALSAVLMRALAKRPEERFSSADELRAALEGALARTPAPARPTPSTFTARLEGHEYTCEPMGRAGLFVRSSEAPPALLSEVPLVLRLPGGELACTGQVVRHVTPE